MVVNNPGYYYTYKPGKAILTISAVGIAFGVELEKEWPSYLFIIGIPLFSYCLSE